MKIKRICAAVLCFCLLCGCGKRENSADEQPPRTATAGYTGMAGDEPELNYEAAVMRPGVLTDQVGYETGSTKIVLFRGGEQDASFEVIDRNTGSTVYSGKLEYEGVDQETGERISSGNFTGLVESGEYWIHVPVLGKSYPFQIADNLYEEVFRSSCLAFEKLWDTEAGYQEQYLTADAETICSLLIAYEYYTSIFQDNLGIEESGNGIPDLMDIIRKRVEGVMSLDSQSLDFEQLSCYVGILSQFAQDYKNIDASYASQCLGAAQEGYRQLERMNRVAFDESFYFYAAAQLYRATGYGNCHTAVKNYLNNTRSSDGQMDFYGKIAYMSCKYTVDSNLCSEIISELMEEMEALSAYSLDDPYLVCSRNLDEICGQMSKLAVVNYVITSHEYVTVQENHLHYLLGRNAEGISYIAGAGQVQKEDAGDGITGDSRKNAALILMMCEIVLTDMAD